MYVKPGEIAVVGDFELRFTACDHGTGAPDAFGVIVFVDGIRIFEAGDTSLHLEWAKDFLEDGPLDVLIAPINGAYGNLNELECAKLAAALRPGVTIPCHYGMFASLASRRVDAKEFIRAFMNSRAAEGLDAPYDRMQWAGEEYIYKTVVQEAGLKPSATRRRYNRDALFYAGYIYRYWHYLTGESSRAIYQQADENQILRSYGYHTESNELAIADLKEAARRSCSGEL